jgi:hypothetical protein
LELEQKRRAKGMGVPFCFMNTCRYPLAKHTADFLQDVPITELLLGRKKVIEKPGFKVIINYI